MAGATYGGEGNKRTFSPEGYQAAAGAGGMRSNGNIGSATRQIAQRPQYQMPYSRPALPNEATTGAPVPNINVQPVSTPTLSGARGPVAFDPNRAGTYYGSGSDPMQSGYAGDYNGAGQYIPRDEADRMAHMKSHPGEYGDTPQAQAPAQQNPMISSVPQRFAAAPQRAAGPQSFDEYRDALGGSVEAYGRRAGRGMQQQVGKMLGDLNSIGGLRSGGVQSGLNDITNAYGQEIGDYAAQTAGHALDAWQQGDQFTRSQEQQESQFGRDLAERGREFDADLGFRGSQLAENRRQFDSDLDFRHSSFDKDFGLRSDMAGWDRDFRAGDLTLRQNAQNDDRAQWQKEYDFRNQQYQDAKAASRKRGIGKILGGALGIASNFIPGGSVVGKIVGGLSGAMK